MTYNIDFYNSDNNITWTQQLFDTDYKNVSTYFYTRQSVSLIKATLCPVRTDSGKNFAIDFFLPTTINHAMKVQNTVRKIFAILGSLLLDAITFPIRLLRGPFRMATNKKQSNHHLYQYLSMNGADKKLFESNHIRVRIHFPAGTGELMTKEINVNFIDLPIHKDSDHFLERLWPKKRKSSKNEEIILN